VTDNIALTAKQLRTPRAAAIAGLLFAALLIAVLTLFLSSVPKDPLEKGAWLSVSVGRVVLAINLIPFAGIAFLWFIGVVRDRLGEAEDRLFATVFLGSGLLFLAMLFVSAATFGAIVVVYAAWPDSLANSPTFALARAFAYVVVNVYAIKMAGVFMMVTSTLGLRTGFIARWIAILGLVLALCLLFGSQLFDWSFAVFPAWVVLISGYILVDNFQLVPARRRA
jgi:hypothetical protein